MFEHDAETSKSHTRQPGSVIMSLKHGHASKLQARQLNATVLIESFLLHTSQVDVARIINWVKVCPLGHFISTAPYKKSVNTPQR
jgi:hypothetical protein